VVLEPVPVPVPVPVEPLVPLEPLEPPAPLVPEAPAPEVPPAPVLPPMPLEPDEEPVPPVPIESLEPLVPPEPVMPVPEPLVPLEPLEPLEPAPPVVPEPEAPPLPLPLPPAPLELLEPLVPMLPLPEVPPCELLPDPLLPELLLPELPCFLDCFFLLELLDEPLEPWSCELALLPPLVDELPLVCAWAVIAPHIATATEAPSRPFSNLFIFMSLSFRWGHYAQQYQPYQEDKSRRRSVKRSPQRVRAVACRKILNVTKGGRAAQADPRFWAARTRIN
jgi:signal-induced proliferation-associated 1 like protein 3